MTHVNPTQHHGHVESKSTLVARKNYNLERFA